MNGHPPDIPGTGDPGEGAYFACPGRLHAKKTPVAAPVCLDCEDRPVMDEISQAEYQRIRTSSGPGDDL